MFIEKYLYIFSETDVEEVSFTYEFMNSMDAKKNIFHNNNKLAKIILNPFFALDCTSEAQSTIALHMCCLFCFCEGIKCFKIHGRLTYLNWFYARIFEKNDNKIEFIQWL